jgi:EAL domain-containing protein (putative c-di-GMP-specific phosphodiesterase class I)
VTAEGIETARQWRQLRDLGCQFAQGFLFSRPLDAVAATALVEGDQNWLPEDSVSVAVAGR